MFAVFLLPPNDFPYKDNEVVLYRTKLHFTFRRSRHKCGTVVCSRRSIHRTGRRIAEEATLWERGSSLWRTSRNLHINRKNPGKIGEGIVLPLNEASVSSAAVAGFETESQNCRLDRNTVPFCSVGDHADLDSVTVGHTSPCGGLFRCGVSVGCKLPYPKNLYGAETQSEYLDMVYAESI